VTVGNRSAPDRTTLRKLVQASFSLEFPRQRRNHPTSAPTSLLSQALLITLDLGRYCYLFQRLASRSTSYIQLPSSTVTPRLLVVLRIHIHDQ